MKHKYHYKNAHHYNGITFPDGNKKQDRCISIALAPEHTCPKDAPCRRENGGSCYFQAEGLRFPSVAKSAHNNWIKYAENPDRFWDAVDSAIEYAEKEGIPFRWFEGGDIPSLDFFEKIMERARKHPGLMHGMTKQYWIVNSYISDHGGDKRCVLDYYNIRYSKWDNYPMDNRYDMPVFALTFKEEETTCVEQRMKMIGKEWSCQNCYDHKCGCYKINHSSINCIDHAEESKIIRRKKKEGVIK